MGVLLSIEGASARVRLFDVKVRNPIDVDEPLLDLRSFGPIEAPAPDPHKNPVFQQQAEQFFRNDKLGFPRMAGNFDKFEAQSLGRPWSNYNGFAFSVGRTNELIFGATCLKEQDIFYSKHGFSPLDGRPTASMLQPQDGLTKVLVYSHPENPDKPRHVALMGKDGLWSIKLGQGPHIKVADPALVTGGDAGSFARMYVKAPKI